MKIYWSSFVLIIVLFSAEAMWSDNIIIDLDKVLFHTDDIASLKQIKIANFIHGMVKSKSPPMSFHKSLKTKFDDVLFTVSELNAEICSSPNYAFDDQGMLYPPILNAWLDGTLTTQKIRNLLIASIENNPDWFLSKVEQKIIIKLVRMVFNAENFVETRKIYKQSMPWVRSFKAHGHKVYILSNWDSESFELLKLKYPQFFAIFDGIIISGHEHLLKPSPIIFQKALERYGLNPDITWYIDDQRENVEVANALNMHGLQCFHKGFRKQPDFDRLTREIL